MGLFTESVNPDGFEVENLPDYIFLCGAKMGDFRHALRAHFHGRIKQTDPDLFQEDPIAEDADSWYRSRKLYDDLLELEEHLAGLSACTLLFLESPGAIAELGVFSQSPGLREKLFVVIEQSHYRENSFIRNGPIERMSRTLHEHVWIYPWLTAGGKRGSRRVDAAIVDATLDAVIIKLRKALSKRREPPKFSA